MSHPLAYSLERMFDASVEDVWDAWVEPVALETWYHPTDLAVLPGSVVSDARPGGVWTVGVDVPQHGIVAYFYGSYTEVIDHAVLVHTMNYTQSPEEFAARIEADDAHRVVIDFEARRGSTWVRFAQYGELPEGQAALAQAGMESYFDSLEAFLG